MKFIKILLFGGTFENGKCMYSIEIDNKIFLFECGIKYFENNILGIEIVIPDFFSYIKKNIKKIYGLFLTHGHFKNIGSICYFCSLFYSIPIYATNFVLEIIKINIKNNFFLFKNNKKKNIYNIISEKSLIKLKNIEISFFKVTHSFPDSLGVKIKTIFGNIIYTSDFKIDYSVSKIYKTDFLKLLEISKEKNLFLLSDSKNSECINKNLTEKQIFIEIFENIRYFKNRIIISCDFDNFQIIQHIINIAYKVNRKIIIISEKFNEILNIAIKLGKIILPSNNIFCLMKNIDNLKLNNILILIPGNIKKIIKIFKKMSINIYKNIKIINGDLIYITNKFIFDIEVEIYKIIDLIYKSGGIVKQISNNISNHADIENLRLMFEIIKPRYFIPINGEYRQLLAHANIAKEFGICDENIFIIKPGNILEYKNNILYKKNNIFLNSIMIDNYIKNINNNIGFLILKERKILSEEGILIIVVAIDFIKRKIISSIKIDSRGFIYINNKKNLIKESYFLVKEIILKNLSIKENNLYDLKRNINSVLGKYFFNYLGRKPVILSVIMCNKQKKIYGVDKN